MFFEGSSVGTQNPHGVRAQLAHLGEALPGLVPLPQRPQNLTPAVGALGALAVVALCAPGVLQRACGVTGPETRFRAPQERSAVTVLLVALPAAAQPVDDPPEEPTPVKPSDPPSLTSDYDAAFDALVRGDLDVAAVGIGEGCARGDHGRSAFWLQKTKEIT